MRYARCTGGSAMNAIRRASLLVLCLAAARPSAAQAPAPPPPPLPPAPAPAAVAAAPLGRPGRRRVRRYQRQLGYLVGRRRFRRAPARPGLEDRFGSECGPRQQPGRDDGRWLFRLATRRPQADADYRADDRNQARTRSVLGTRLPIGA